MAVWPDFECQLAHKAVLHQLLPASIPWGKLSRGLALMVVLVKVSGDNGSGDEVFN